jgi:hypothetical protein
METSLNNISFAKTKDNKKAKAFSPWLFLNQLNHQA